MNAKFYQVGGSVRDGILGIKNKDVDYAVEAVSFDAMRQAIIALGGKIFLETPQYFTIRAHVPNLGATDYTLCRRDGNYTDGRHPDSVVVGSIYDDLARRDFTMNAIAIHVETGKHLDPYCGIKDIESKVIRCVGNPMDRFEEDKLRVFRAMRFAITKGFHIDPKTLLAMQEINDYSGVSTERIREELYKMFACDSCHSFVAFWDTMPIAWRVIRERGIWFKPTVEKI